MVRQGWSTSHQRVNRSSTLYLDTNLYCLNKLLGEMNIIRTTFGYFLEPLHQDTIVHICMSPPQPSALVLAVPRSCRFHKSFPTSRATVLLDPVVALHVSHQTCFLNELLSTFLTFIISYSSVNLFVPHANTCEPKSF